ncbi:MAG: hypothetical protein CVU97_06640 [Firmicutes bacterium HGW-Firmicutes-21]|nr:MAG: hypothetical protein CVU97_06640 [Firmicutes bacterium HGW-Firmicutes-21]
MLHEYYNNSNEDGRLRNGKVNKVEYITTLHFLMKHLPIKCSVLDCCAGTGVYAIPLAEAGYKVTAGDLIQKHVDIIKAIDSKGLLEGVFQGDVLDMSRFADSSFDAVLCLGALYHLQTEREREKAVTECLRVLKKGGIFVFSYINRNACFINHFKKAPSQVEQTLRLLDDDSGKVVFYAMDFGEADKLMNKFDTEKIVEVGTDGLKYVLYEEINTLDDEQFASYMKYQLATCAQPSIIGHSMHGLWIGRKQ